MAELAKHPAIFCGPSTSSSSSIVALAPAAELTSTNGQAEEKQNNLWVDLDQESGRAQFVCIWAECQQRFFERDNFEAHMEAHLAFYGNRFGSEGQDPLELCPVCQVRGCQILVSNMEELSRHLKMHIFHANKQLCGLLAVSERYPELKTCNFVATSRLVYQGDPLICEWNACFVTFTDINAYMIHIETHIAALNCETGRNERGHYDCKWSECHQSYRHKGTLRWHVQHHSGDKMCACPFCGAFFAHTSRLMEHVTRRQKGGQLMCHFCRKTFMNETLLRQHCKRHVKQHKCQFCSLVLDTPSDLNRHVQGVHAKVKNHVCEYCGRAFFQKTDWTRHIELHFNDKVHECGECGERFRWAKQLREHGRKHKEGYIQSPYRCHVCDSRYRRGSALSKHLVQSHQLEVPSGFSRFQYKKCSDGLYRLQTTRYVLETLMETTEVAGEEEE